LTRVSLVFVLLALVGYGVYKWEKRGEGFRLRKIQEKLTYDPRWELSVTPEELSRAKKILQEHSFRYLGHGFQCYAFESEDGQYVLKFFRYQRLRLPSFIQEFPSLPFLDEWRKERLVTLNHRRECLLRSCKTSWELAKRETALLFVHLNQTKGLFGKTSLLDTLGEKHLLVMDDYQFLLQKKALHIKPEFDRLMANGQVEEAKRRVDQIFELLLDCARKSVQDMDGALIRKNNLGFLHDRAIYVDGGKMTYRECIRSKKWFEKDLHRLYMLNKWFKEKYPVLSRHLEEKQQCILQNFDLFLTKEPRSCE